MADPVEVPVESPGLFRPLSREHIILEAIDQCQDSSVCAIREHVHSRTAGLVSLPRASVYRTINDFEELGFIEKESLKLSPKGVSRVQLNRRLIAKLSGIGLYGEEADDSFLTVEEKSRLAAYRSQYACMSLAFPWAAVKNRLLANDAYYLNLAAGLNGNGVFIGMDDGGNPLFADRFVTGMRKTYAEFREWVRFKNQNGQKVSTGYELFPYARNYELSPEIKMFQASSARPFLRTLPGGVNESVWLESGANPQNPRVARLDSFSGAVKIVGANPQEVIHGVMRLLRLKPPADKSVPQSLLLSK